MDAPRRARGRPRDPEIDAVVLSATRALLAEAGFAGTTVQEVSRRSGVHPPGIYRRWPTRIALIEDAAFGELATVAIEPTGDLRDDLSGFLAAYEASLDTPAARAAIPGLLANQRSDERPQADRWVHLSVRPQFAAILAASSETDADLDVDEAFDVVLSLVLARLILPPLSSSRRPIERLVDVVLRVVRHPCE